MKRPTLQNTGEVDELDEVMDDQENGETENGAEATEELTGNVGGFAPGVAAHITGKQSHPASNNVTPESDDGANLSDADEKKSKNRAMRALRTSIATVGTAYGAGKTSMITLAETITDAATKALVSPENAGELYDIFRKNADARATIGDDNQPVPDEAIMEKAPNETADKSRTQQVSKLAGFIKMGNKFDETANDTIRRARNIHLALLKGDRSTVKAGSTYTQLCAVAAAQMKKENLKPLRPLTDDDLHALMTTEAKAEARDKTGADKIIEAIKAVRAAQNGSDNRAPVTSVHLDDAMQSLRASLADAEDGAETLAEYDAEVQAVEDRKVAAADAKAARDAEKAANAAAKSANKAA